MWPFTNWRLEALEYEVAAHGRKIDELFRKVGALTDTKADLEAALRELKAVKEKMEKVAK